jgi:hypothetical protein
MGAPVDCLFLERKRGVLLPKEEIEIAGNPIVDDV